MKGIEFAGESFENGWEIVVYSNVLGLGTICKSIVKTSSKRKKDYLTIAKNILLLALIPICCFRFSAPIDVAIMGWVLASKLTSFIFISNNVRKNHFCEHYVVNRLLNSNNENNEWFNERCGSILSLKILVFAANYLAIRAAMLNHHKIVEIVVLFDIILILFWAKLKKLWQWKFMAVPEEWRLELARQQIKEIRKILEFRGIYL